MILSFSVPSNQKFNPIIEWYSNADKQERSREFRKIFLSYLQSQPHIMEQKPSAHVSTELQRVNLIEEDEEIDFDEKINLIGRRG